MNDFVIGPMRLAPARPGHFLWRGQDFAGYFRDETEGRRVAVALSMLSDEQWKEAAHILIQQAETMLARVA